jgi:hypothetical protein
VAVVNIELPIDMKKQPDTKPNVPIDVTVPLIPKELQLPGGGYVVPNTYQLPNDTGNLIIIWSAKHKAAVSTEESK